MEIPHSTIEPFGVLGFPMPLQERRMTIEMIEKIMDALDVYLREYMELIPDGEEDTIDTNSVRVHLQQVAVRHGADWASSKAIESRVRQGRYVFIITYGFLSSTEEYTHVLSTAKF